MNTATTRILVGTPRVLCILFALFISMFALDVFDEGYDVWHTLLALLIHLLPTWIVLAVLLIAWRWAWVGGVVCLGLGAFYVYWSWGKFDWTAPACIAGPLLVTGILFWISWLYRPVPRKARRSSAGRVR